MGGCEKISNSDSDFYMFLFPFLNIVQDAGDPWKDARDLVPKKCKFKRNVILEHELASNRVVQNITNIACSNYGTPLSPKSCYYVAIEDAFN